MRVLHVTFWQRWQEEEDTKINAKDSKAWVWKVWNIDTSSFYLLFEIFLRFLSFKAARTVETASFEKAKGVIFFMKLSFCFEMQGLSLMHQKF